MKIKNSQWMAILTVGGVGLLTIARMTAGFSPGPDREVLAVALQSNGKVVVGGRFSETRIERRNTDGSVDATFAQSWVTGGFNNGVLALVIQPDDRIIAVGEFTNFDSSIVGHIARLNADGSLDTEFARAAGTGFDGTVSSAFVQPDGKIVVGGNFSSFNGSAAQRLARLNADGSLDPDFKAEEGADGTVLVVHPNSPDAKRFLAGGDFQTYRKAARPNVAGILTDGNLDAEYPR